MKKKHILLLVVGAVIISLLSICGTLSFMKKKSSAPIVVQVSDQSQIQGDIEWKHYVDTTYAKFEMDYPASVTPSIEQDMNLYAIQFGTEASVQSTPMSKAQYDTLQTQPQNLGEVYIGTTSIGGYTGSVFKEKISDTEFSPDTKITFYANGLMYMLWLHNPLHIDHMIRSFKVRH